MSGKLTERELKDAFFAAVRNDDRPAVVRALAKGMPIECRNGDALTPLRESIRYARREMAALLVAYGADKNTRDSQGKTPIHAAIEKKAWDIAGDLARAGADVNAPDGLLRETPLILLVETAGGKDAGAMQLAQLLLEKGARPNEQNTFLNTALKVAVGKSDVLWVRALLEAGADPNIGNRHAEELPLHVAAKKTAPSREIVAALLAAGAVPDLVTDRAAKPWAQRLIDEHLRRDIEQDVSGIAQGTVRAIRAPRLMTPSGKGPAP